MDRDGVDATMMFPNLSFFALYTDVHERSIAHARVYNDWLAETYLPYSNRIRPAAAIPTTNVADGVKEIERAVRLGLTTLILPEIPQPLPYWAPEYEPIWAAAEANGLPIFFHVASGGVDSKAGTSATGSQVKGILTAMTMGKQELDRRPAGRAHHGRRQHRRRQPDADHRRPGQRGRRASGTPT